MTPAISTFEPGEATEEQLRAYHTVIAAAWAHEMPEDPPYAYEAAVGRLLDPPAEEGPSRHWWAHLDGEMAGFAKVAFGTDENVENARVEVWVHPAVRRRGIGDALLHAVLPTVTDAGRSTVIGGIPMKAGSAGSVWARRLGFQVTYSSAIQVLTVSPEAERLWNAPVADEYELAQWIGAAPDHLLQSYAAARPAIEDAPNGQTSHRSIAWTADRVRQNEREQAERGVEDHVVAALSRATGEVVGLTVLRCYPHRRDNAYQGDTVVLASHRGHGLGRAMKGAMLRRITAERPDLQRVYTSTAADNAYMIDVNMAVGFHLARKMDRMETGTADLVEAVARQAAGVRAGAAECRGTEAQARRRASSA